MLEKLPQLKQKYRPTPWLTNNHVHLLYFDLIRKQSIKLEYDRIDQLTMSDAVLPQLLGMAIIYQQIHQRL